MSATKKGFKIIKTIFSVEGAVQVTGSTPNIVNEAAHTHATVSHFKEMETRCLWGALNYQRVDRRILLHGKRNTRRSCGGVDAFPYSSLRTLRHVHTLSVPKPKVIYIFIVFALFRL